MSLTILKRNKFGNPMYGISQNDNSNDEKTPLPSDNDGVWTILNPNSDIIKLYPDCEIRQYGSNKLLMSKCASDKIQKPYNHDGAALVISFVYNGIKYFILVADNKPYLQNVQGGMIDDDKMDPRLCAVRELMEELNITINTDMLTYIGKYGFIYKNDIIGDYAHPATTHVFKINLKFEDVQHLIQHELNPNDTNIQFFKLDETEFVVMIPEHLIDNLPNKINGKEFGNHHREILHRQVSSNKKISTSHLAFFEIIT
jgi:8-oxo-dGTP pyrophosphatase MutT (NUDIX family)